MATEANVVRGQRVRGSSQFLRLPGGLVRELACGGSPTAPAPVRALQPEHRCRTVAESRVLGHSRRRQRPTSCRPAAPSWDDVLPVSPSTGRCHDDIHGRKANARDLKARGRPRRQRERAVPRRGRRSAVSEVSGVVARCRRVTAPVPVCDSAGLRSHREWDAPARRPAPGIRGRADAVLGFALRQHAPSEPLRCTPHVDRTMVQSLRRTLVARLVLPSSCGRAHGPAAMQRDAPGCSMSQSTRCHWVGRVGRDAGHRLAVPRS